MSRILEEQGIEDLNALKLNQSTAGAGGTEYNEGDRTLLQVMQEKDILMQQKAK